MPRLEEVQPLEYVSQTFTGLAVSHPSHPTPFPGRCGKKVASSFCAGIRCFSRRLPFVRVILDATHRRNGEGHSCWCHIMVLIAVKMSNSSLEITRKVLSATMHPLLSLLPLNLGLRPRIHAVTRQRSSFVVGASDLETNEPTSQWGGRGVWLVGLMVVGWSECKVIVFTFVTWIQI